MRLEVLLTAALLTRVDGFNSDNSTDIGTAKLLPPLAPVIMFPAGAATGILVALAVPVDLADRSVFVSYNFEMNYGMPTTPGQALIGPLDRVS